jgi:hypothetical protein
MTFMIIDIPGPEPGFPLKRKAAANSCGFSLTTRAKARHF